MVSDLKVNNFLRPHIRGEAHLDRAPAHPQALKPLNQCKHLRLHIVTPKTTEIYIPTQSIFFGATIDVHVLFSCVLPFAYQTLIHQLAQC